jgi:hypothetical protein
VGALLPLTNSLVLWAQQAKRDIDLRTLSSHGTPSIQYVHNLYPFALEDGSGLAPMAVELVDRLAILVADRRFPSLDAVNSRSLRYES